MKYKYNSSEYLYIHNICVYFLKEIYNIILDMTDIFIIILQLLELSKNVFII